jgi:hypothetical protein
MLVASYGVAQGVISWAFGRIVDLHGYAPLTLIGALTPAAACAVLAMPFRKSEPPRTGV